MKYPRWVLTHIKKKPRIYIMPTKMGGYLNGLIFLMFLLAVGYNNNLLLIFTLFLFGFNLIWVIQTHYHLHALKVSSVSIEDNHANEPQLVTVQWKKSPGAPVEWQVYLETKYDSYPLAMFSHDEKSSVGEVKLLKRGIWHFAHIKVASEKPFGLYRSWVYLPVEARAFVYPERLKDVPSVMPKDFFSEGDSASSKKGPHDVSNLSPYQGESSKFISWKHYARSGDLVVKEGEELSQSLIHFRLNPEHPQIEFILSQIATQMVLCANNSVSFTYEGPQIKLGPGSDGRYLAECLRELASC